MLLFFLALPACAESDGDTASSTDTAATVVADGSVEAALGEHFVDPQGTYTITIDPEWQDASGAFVAEVEGWTIGPAEDGFQPNVNVLTQLAPGLDLASYMELSLQGMSTMNVVRHLQIQGSNGNALGLLEYSGVLPGMSPDLELHFLATFDVRSGQAVVATLTTLNRDYEELAKQAEAFLLSLQAT